MVIDSVSVDHGEGFYNPSRGFNIGGTRRDPWVTFGSDALPAQRAKVTQGVDCSERLPRTIAMLCSEHCFHADRSVPQNRETLSLPLPVDPSNRQVAWVLV